MLTIIFYQYHTTNMIYKWTSLQFTDPTYLINHITLMTHSHRVKCNMKHLWYFLTWIFTAFPLWFRNLLNNLIPTFILQNRQWTFEFWHELRIWILMFSSNVFIFNFTYHVSSSSYTKATGSISTPSKWCLHNMLSPNTIDYSYNPFPNLKIISLSVSLPQIIKSCIKLALKYAK